MPAGGQPVRMRPRLELATHLAGRAGAEREHRIRVVLADDHSLVRRALRRLLDSEDGIEVVQEAIDLNTAVSHVRTHAPHVLVIDLDLPNGSTLLTLGELRRRAPRTEIVVLAMEPSPLFARRVLQAGAVGYVLKDQADSELTAAIRAAARGERYVSPQVAAALGALDAVERDGGLSGREVEVLQLTALGYTGAEVASKLHISRRTVDTHRANIHAKLGLRTRAELVDYALGHGVIGDA